MRPSWKNAGGKGGVPPIRAKQKFKSGFNEQWATFEFDHPSISGRKYMISNFGRIASYLNNINQDGVILKQVKLSNGDDVYAQLSTFQIVTDKKGNQEKVRIGQLLALKKLVATNFVPNDDPENKTEIIFLDHDPTNVNFENLKWATEYEENAHKKTNPKHEEKLVKKYQSRKLSLSKARKLKGLVLEGRLKPTTLAKMFGLSLTQIYRIRWNEYLQDVDVPSKE